MLALSLLLCTLAAPEPLTLYISPSGDVKNSGSDVNHALPSLAAARDAIRTIRAAKTTVGPITVEVAPGTYFLPETLAFTSDDSGTADSPITYRASKPNTVIISGGTLLSDWKLVDFDDKVVFSADIPPSVPLPVSTDFHTIWAQRKSDTFARRLPIARTPAEGKFLSIESIPAAEQSASWMQGQRAFCYRESDAAAWAKITPGAEVVTFARWIDSHLTVKSIDHKTRTVTFTLPSTTQISAGDLYYIENDRSLITTAPEFWCDPAARRIYVYSAYIDAPGEPAAHIMPRLTTLLEIRGTASAPISNLHFQNLTFAHAKWWFPADFQTDFGGTKSRGFIQAANGCPGAVICNYMTNSSFQNCTIAHVEQYGLELRRGCRENVIDSCTITDLGAGALKFGETSIATEAADKTANNTIEACILTDGGQIHHQAVGVWIGQSPGNKLRYNRISDFDYSGISIGWTWGYGPADAGANIVEFNEVCNLGSRSGNSQPPLGDMAGIYTLGNQAGTVIRQNFFHDIFGRSIAWGIYFDEGTTDIVATHNIVTRTSHGGFHQHYGKNNTVQGNIFAFGRDAQLWRSRKEDHLSFTFTDNIILAAPGANVLSGDWSGNISLARNVFWRTDGTPFSLPNNLTFEQWQASINDSTSRVIDPGFVDPIHDGFTLTAASAAGEIISPVSLLYFKLSHTYGPAARPQR